MTSLTDRGAAPRFRRMLGADVWLCVAQLFATSPAPFSADLEREIGRALTASDSRALTAWLDVEPGVVAWMVERRLLEGDFDSLRQLFSRSELTPALEARLGPSFANWRSALDGQPCDVVRLDALESDALARAEAEVVALDDAGLEVTARVRELEVLDLLADRNQPAALRTRCERLRSRASVAPLEFTRAVALLREGEALRALGDQPGGVACLERAITCLSRYPDSRWLAFAADQLGWGYAMLSRYTSSIAAFELAARTARSADDSDRLARVLRSRGMMHSRLGDLSRAHADLDEAVAVARAAGNQHRVAETLLAKAACFVSHGYERFAAQTLEQASAEWGSKPFDDPRLERRRLFTLCRIRFGEPGTALEPELVSGLNALVGALAAARERSEPELLLAEHHWRAGDPSEGLRWCDRGLEDCGDDDPNCVLLHRMRGLCLARLGRFDEALESLWTMVALRDEGRAQMRDVDLGSRFHHQGLSAEMVRSAVETAFEAYRTTHERRFALETLAFLDWGRMRSLRDVVSERGVPVGVPTAPCRGDALLDGLEPNSVLLAFEFAAGVAVAARGDEIRPFAVPRLEQAELRFAALRHVLFETPALGRFALTAPETSRELLEPIRDLLDGATGIVCLSDGPLLEFPLEFLLSETPGSARADALPFVFRRWKVQYAPWIPRTPRARSCFAGTERALLAFAFTRPARAHALDGAEQEIEDLRRVFAPARAEFHVGEAATEARFKRLAHPRADILHLVGHTVADRERGGDSHVLLGASEGEDGRLSVHELLDLPLAYPLVVVSACEASAGQPLVAEGSISLTWGLLAAGARNVIASPMPVDDALSRRFMRALYAELARGAEPDDAVRAARVRLLADSSAADRDAALLPFHVWCGVR